METTIGDRIRQLREAKGETQAELGKALKVKRETVNQWENGTRDLKTSYTISLADHFETTCDYILRGIDSENVDIQRQIGLSNEAIKVLKALDAIHVEAVSDFISSNNFTDFVSGLYLYINSISPNTDAGENNSQSIFFSLQTEIHNSMKQEAVLKADLGDLDNKMKNLMAKKGLSKVLNQDTLSVEYEIISLQQMIASKKAMLAVTQEQIAHLGKMISQKELLKESMLNAFEAILKELEKDDE